MKKGFTLIELLVVISIIGLLSSIVLASLSSTRMKARDTVTKSNLHQLRNAVELYYNTFGSYPTTAGWFSNPGHGGLDTALVTNKIIPEIPDSPTSVAYMYWRKDYVGYSCLTGGQPNKFGFYARLENPSSADLATLTDSFDQCVKTTWGMNYKVSTD